MGIAIVTNQLLIGLLADKTRRNLVPCLSLAPVKAAPCNCPNQRKDATYTKEELESVKICISRLPPEKLAQLKQLWGVDRVVVHLSTPGLPQRVVL